MTTHSFPSSDGSTTYHVDLRGNYLVCTCPGFKYRKTCWHVEKVQNELPGKSPLGLQLAALAYQRLGYHVIPIQPGNKIPMVTWMTWQTVAADRNQILAWWKRTPDANIGLVLGEGRLVVDLDGGAEAEQLLADAGVVIPADAPRVKTASGLHIYLKAPAAVTDRIAMLKATTPRADGSVTEGGKPRFAQVDVRGRGIIIAPPSVHPSGHVYEWLVPLTENLPDAPASLLALISPPPAPPKSKKSAAPAAEVES